MAKIIVFNNDLDSMETYYRGENEAMPYNTNRTLTVGEFRGSSKSPTLWTTKSQAVFLPHLGNLSRFSFHVGKLSHAG